MSNGSTNSAALVAGGRGNPRSSGYERARNDWYREPAWLVDALLDVEPFEGSIWDPACGGGTIPARCCARGLVAIGSDIVNRGYSEVEQDFLTSELRVNNIITNPPFNLAQEFVEKALKSTTCKVAIVQRLAFLEGQKRKVFFESTPLARVWVSSKRACMPPGEGFSDTKRDQWGALRTEEGRGGAIAYAWFVWDHQHTGPATIGWL